MARIRKHRNKWQVLYRDPARHRERSAGVFDRKVDANRVKSSIERDIATNNWFDRDAGAVSLDEWARRWQASTTALAPASVAAYDSLLRTWILPTFGDSNLADITAMDVREWVASMQSQGCSPGRAGHALMLLRQILATAVDDRRIQTNPTISVKSPKVQHRERPYLQPHEIAELANTVPEQYRALVLVMGVAGLRFGEAAALQRGDIDILRGSIRVSKSVSESHTYGKGERVEVKSPKNGKARNVRIPRFLAEALNQHLQAFTPPDPEARLFKENTGALMRATRFRRWILLPALESAGLNKKVTAHDLRHSAAAAMIAVNPNPQLIKQQLGHATISTTFDIYGHLFPDESDKLAEALETQWNSRRSGPEADQAPVRISHVGT